MPSDERVTTVLQTMQDHLQQTTLIAQRRSQEMLSEQSTSKTKGDAACEAMEAFTQARERQAEAKGLFEPKCEDVAKAEIMFNDTTKHTLEKCNQYTYRAHVFLMHGCGAVILSLTSRTNLTHHAWLKNHGAHC